jgi:hypothetical protein
LESSDTSLERWDLYPFGERSPSKIWSIVTDHPAWSPSLAQVAPQLLPATQHEEGRMVTNLFSSIWGCRLSPTAIRIAAHLLARIQDGPAGRGLRVLRCLTYEEDATPLYHKIRWYLLGLGMMRRCRRIEWEVIEPWTVAVPATFDVIGPSADAGLGDFLIEQGFVGESSWDYRQGPVVFGGASLEGGPLGARAETDWLEYAGRHHAGLLPQPIPRLDPSLLDRFIPASAGASLFHSFNGEVVGQWCPDLAPLVESHGRWDEARYRVTTLRLLRWLPARLTSNPAGHFRLLPEVAGEVFPQAKTLQIGPLPSGDLAVAEWWEAAGYSINAKLTLFSFPL